MREIAEAAGTSVSNLYKYYAGKEELFRAIVGDYALAFIRGYRGDLSHKQEEEYRRDRIQAMGRSLAAALAEAPRLFSILIRRSAGSSYAGFRDELARDLETHLRPRLAETEPEDPLPFSIARNLFESMADIAESQRDFAWTQSAVQRLLAYHMGGMAALEEPRPGGPRSK